MQILKSKIHGFERAKNESAQNNSETIDILLPTLRMMENLPSVSYISDTLGVSNISQPYLKIMVRLNF